MSKILLKQNKPQKSSLEANYGVIRKMINAGVPKSKLPHHDESHGWAATHIG
ncbi:hypothetical protein I8752_24005 [Nostocaceae cyanobacterium CENA369]|uniref:Uncharacterized protein n=1 Tax=Dendronalium phyllosphericum CENA369 TaxID=1725256 RepID=A0A8J7LFH5_9NOST|nr:hypothetical protein [Dendronalium phyllosphericum]MBH8576007.1 hypothetical protein [Dendronalium phyllosphericum CENA369]